MGTWGLGETEARLSYKEKAEVRLLQPLPDLASRLPHPQLFEDPTL